MHTNQISAFRAISGNRNIIIHEPFLLDGHTYATDGRVIIRWPRVMKGFEHFDETTEKGAGFRKAVLAQFDFFANPGVLALIPFDSLKLEPVIERDMFRDGEPNNDNPHMDEAGEAYVCRCSPVKLHARTFDARRLLFIRQHLPDAAYFDEPEALATQPLRFVFDEAGKGQGVFMPLNMKSAPHKHWNGAEFVPGW